MKFTGIARKLDRLGRITIPKEIRDMRGIKENEDLIEIYVHEDMICLRKVEDKISCKLCGGEEEMLKVDGVDICTTCANKVNNAVAKNYLNMRRRSNDK